MKTLALTVLVHEGPMARAYLGMLHASGYRVERVLLMVNKRDPANGRALLPWLPAPLRRPFAKKVQDLRMNHWPREFLRRHEESCHRWLAALAAHYGFDPRTCYSFSELPTYARYAQQVDEVFVDSLADPALERHLRGLTGPRALLFTGGGMVPASLLEIPQCRFLHVHPGVLPSVRGADGLLWSLLLRGRPGASVFYMSPGLDTGDVIETGEFDPPPLPDGFAAMDIASRYRLLYSFLDPLLRARMLLRVIERAPTANLCALPAKAQSGADGSTFHFMSARLRRFTFDRLCSMASLRGEPA
jgi:hypothetical protein